MRIITSSLESLDDTAWEKLTKRCVEILQNNGKIFASGLGKNAPICEKFVGTLNSFGIDARFLHSNAAAHGDLGMVNKNDLVIILSKSGNTAESVDLAKYLINRGTEIWLVTFNKESKLTRLVKNQILLHLEHEGDQWNVSPNNSTMVNLVLLQGLAIELSKRLGIKLGDFQINHPGGGIGEILENYKECI